MPVESRYFIVANERQINEGVRVRYDSKRWGSGTGIVTMVYLAMEEFLRIRRDSEEPTYCRAGFAPPEIDLWIEGDNVFRVDETEAPHA